MSVVCVTLKMSFDDLLILEGAVALARRADVKSASVLPAQAVFFHDQIDCYDRLLAMMRAVPCELPPLLEGEKS